MTRNLVEAIKEMNKDDELIEDINEIRSHLNSINLLKNIIYAKLCDIEKKLGLYPDLWCPFCERVVKLEEIQDVENDQPACPDCKFFLVEKV